MIWLTWRQFRTQAAVVFGGLTVLAAVLAVTGPGLAHDYTTGVAGCTAHGDCSSFTRQFLSDHKAFYVGLVAVVVLLPALIGLFWGAPLITRELEAGTHRLVWNQSVTRTRWLAVKLLLTGLAAMAAAGLASLAVTWWSSPIDKVTTEEFPRFSPLMFDARGIVPVGYAAFAFTLGVTVGILIRRTLPAMAVTVAAFAVVQIVMPLWIRPHLIEPTHVTTAITAQNLRSFLIGDDGIIVTVRAGDPDAWAVSNRTVDTAGHAVGPLPKSLAAKCMPAPPAPGASATEPPRGPAQECFAEISRLGYRQQVDYHPADRYWTFQWYETGIFLVLSLLLAGFGFRWTRNRLS